MRKTIIWLFVLALSIRAVIAIIQMEYGIDNSLNFDLYLYGPFNPGLEIFHDFSAYYVGQLIDLWKGFIPYKDFAYSYPPLFLYTLYPFYLLDGPSAASIPIWASDAATAPLIYLVARYFANTRLSLIAGISYAISPFFLLYEGYLWLSSQPMTFFMILSLYLLLTRRPLWSALIFAIAVLFKQELILIFPVYLIWYIKSYSKLSVLRAVATLIAVILAVSLPFIIITPQGYLSAISYGFLAPSTFTASGYSNVGTLGGVPNSLTTSQSLICTTISSTWRSQICNYGNFSYTLTKHTPSWTVILSWPFLDQLGIWLFLPMLVVTVYNLIRLRHDETTLFLFGSVIMTGFLAFFAIDIHTIYRYYLIPAYVFPLVSSRTRLSLVVAIVLPVLSLVFPSGNVQLLFPLFDVLLVLLLNQRSVYTPKNITMPAAKVTLPQNSISLKNSLSAMVDRSEMDSGQDMECKSIPLRSMGNQNSIFLRNIISFKGSCFHEQTTRQGK
jgi:hypothetical protein